MGTGMSIGWELNVNLGTVIPIIFAAGVFYAVTKNDIKTLRDAIVKIDKAMEKQTETIQQISVQKTQIESQSAQIIEMQKAQRLLDERLYDLSKGQGWIKDRHRKTVDGEYP